jgi:hypothetical protein
MAPPTNKSTSRMKRRKLIPEDSRCSTALGVIGVLKDPPAH